MEDRVSTAVQEESDRSSSSVKRRLAELDRCLHPLGPDHFCGWPAAGEKDGEPRCSDHQESP